MGVAPASPYQSLPSRSSRQQVATSQAAGVDAQPAYEACEQYQGCQREHAALRAKCPSPSALNLVFSIVVPRFDGRSHDLSFNEYVAV